MKLKYLSMYLYLTLTSLTPRADYLQGLANKPIDDAHAKLSYVYDILYEHFIIIQIF